MNNLIRIYPIAFCLILVPRLLTAQNIGIGIQAPQVKLHVAEGNSGASPFAFTKLAIEGNTHTYINLLSPANLETAILFGNPNNSASGVIMYNNTSTPNGFQFRTGGNITRMTITNTGQVGINNFSPQATLDVGGSLRANNLILNLGGNHNDFLIRDQNGFVTNRKGHGGIGLNYIIAIQGSFPNTIPPQQTGQPYIGEIRLFAGLYAPAGWLFCHGQLLPIVSNQTLFAIIGTTYGGDGQFTFALPDLRGVVPVGGTSGGQWEIGERSF
jgi:hypothetical protein